MARDNSLHAVPAPRKPTRRGTAHELRTLAKTFAVETPPDQAKQPPKLDEGERETLVMLRDTLKKRINGGTVPAQALASLIKQFREVDKEIRAIDARAEREYNEDTEAADHAWDDSDI